MPEHIDPFRELENFGSGGIVTTPLDPSEVRRLGNKRRVQRRAGIAGAVAALIVAAVVVPVAVIANQGDDRAVPTGPPTVVVPTPTPTQSATAEPTTITYPGDGVGITDPADVDKLTGTSSEFKAFIADQVRHAQEAGKQCPDAAHQVTVQKYSSAGYAYGSYNDCGGYVALWVDKDDVWREGYGTQDAWDCDTLRYFSIPRSFVGGQCFAEQSEDFGPKTYAGLRLGMTREQVTAAGATVDGGSKTTCGGLLLPYSQPIANEVDGYLSPAKGLVAIFARPGIKTHEGIGLGSTLKQVQEAYPDAASDELSGITIPHGDGTELQIFVDQSDIVQSMSLRMVDQDCFD